MYGICMGFIWGGYGHAMGLRDEQTRRIGDRETWRRGEWNADETDSLMRNADGYRFILTRCYTMFYTESHGVFVILIVLKKRHRDVTLVSGF